MDSRGARTKASSSPNFMKTSRSCDASATTGTSACTRRPWPRGRRSHRVLLELPVGTREPQEVLDDSLEAVAFTPIRSSADRYDCASRSLLRAMDTSASMTLSGVLSSCEASAVNSRWRRCARRSAKGRECPPRMRRVHQDEEHGAEDQFGVDQ